MRGARISASASNAPMKNFNSFAENVNSQYGEDGIIREILRRMNRAREPGVRHCVEFGAWDGIHLSNTYNLIARQNYHAVLIEADPIKFRALSQNIPESSVVKINTFVTFDGATTLDNILSGTDISEDFDLLSIDIDGNDYHVFESLTRYRPRLVCIEFNPTIPNAVDYVQPRDFRVQRGASARAIATLGARKGYAVVAATYCNLLLLDRSCLPDVGLTHEPELEDVRDDRDAIRYVFCGYDGTVLLSRPLRMPWHGLQVSEGELQVLPSALRRFPDDYNALQWTAFQFLRAFRNPAEAYLKVRRRLRL
jgi:hypothetical protein